MKINFCRVFRKFKKEKKMRDYNLNFITNEDLFNHVQGTINSYNYEIDLAKFVKNILDPIKMTFDAKVHNKNIDEIIRLEIMRQQDKTVSNEIGYFHQNIFKYVFHIDNSALKWIVPETGFDIVCPNGEYHVEMKNKHNTMNSSSSQKTYIKMLKELKDNPNAKQCFLVEVLAKKSQNIPWTISIDGDKTTDNDIRRVSVDNFYEIVTGETHSFKNLLLVLPLVIEDVLKVRKKIKTEKNTVLKDLEAIDPNILQSIHKLSFKSYLGFEDFEIKK